MDLSSGRYYQTTFLPRQHQRLRGRRPTGRPLLVSRPPHALARLTHAVRRAAGWDGRPLPSVLLPLLWTVMSVVSALAVARWVPTPQTPAPVRTVEQIVLVHEGRGHAPHVPPILRKIAACESNDTHYDRQGRVLRGRVNTHDIGKYQINTAIWGAVAAQQGYDVYDAQGNEQMALYLFHHYGSMPWQSSAPCWTRK